MDINELLSLTQNRAGSDLHLSSGNPPMMRVDGEIRPLDPDHLTGEAIESMVYPIMTEEQRARFESEGEVDFSFEFNAESRFRVNVFTNRQGAAVVFRAIPSDILSLEDIGAPRIVKRMAELDKGLVLVTGPTGSGKSTTLAAMIEHINSTARRHILTIEDPIEFVYRPKLSLINQREVGRDTKSFARALRSALREDPDVILVGEMRDHETISLALTAAETGHLVMGTLHASSAAKTVDRIIDVFPAGDKPMVRTMLAGSLQGVIAQGLLKREDAKGQIAAFEILVGTPAVRNLIRENKVPQIFTMMQVGAEFGMQTMQDAIEALIARGVVAEDEANRLLSVAAEGDEHGPADRARQAGTVSPAASPAAGVVRANPDEYSF